MRTIKQLSVEKDILEQYSRSIGQARKLVFLKLSHPEPNLAPLFCRTFWKLDIVTDLFYGVLYGVEPFFSALLFWCALILCENNKLALDKIVM